LTTSISGTPVGPLPGAERRVLILGDSWVRGLGPERRAAFGKLIAKGIGATELVDLSAISRTAPDFVNDHLVAVRESAPVIAIVNIGGADSLIFPAWRVQRFIDRFAPPHWHGVAGLMPIARYSRDRKRRRRQIVENVAKVMIKQLIVNLFGGRRRVGVPEFESAARTLMSQLHQLGTLMIVVGLGPVDPFLSPKTNSSVRKTNVVLARLCDELPGAVFIPTTRMVRRWDDYLSDHVHLSADGHRHIAEGVLAALAQRGDQWVARPIEVTA